MNLQGRTFILAVKFTEGVGSTWVLPQLLLDVGTSSLGSLSAFAPADKLISAFCINCTTVVFSALVIGRTFFKSGNNTKPYRWAQVLKVIQTLITLLLLFTGLTACCQTSKPKLIGKFSDNISELKINTDSTFELKTPDYVFPNTFTVYQNRDHWTYSNNVITLNPNQAKRQPKLLLIEKIIEGADS